MLLYKFANLEAVVLFSEQHNFVLFFRSPHYACPEVIRVSHISTPVLPKAVHGCIYRVSIMMEEKLMFGVVV